MKLLTAFCAACLLTSPVLAQTTAESKPAPAPQPRPEFGKGLEYKTFYLANASSPNEGNEILTNIRVMVDPAVHIFLDNSRNAITMRATPADIALAERIVHDLDKPQKTYRLTYTVATVDHGALVGDQHFTMVATLGDHTTLKQGSRVPLAETSSQLTFLDVGLNIQAHLVASGSGVRLESKVEQSSFDGVKAVNGSQQPLTRQTTLEGAAFLSPGKPVLLGSLDIPDSPRHLDISVEMDPLP